MPFLRTQYISNEKTFLKKYLQLYFDSLRIFYGRNICICICICVWQVLLLKYIQHINKLPVGKFFKVVEIFFSPRIHCIPSVNRRYQSLHEFTTVKNSFCQACSWLSKSNTYWLGQLFLTLSIYVSILKTHISNLDVWKSTLSFLEVSTSPSISYKNLINTKITYCLHGVSFFFIPHSFKWSILLYSDDLHVQFDKNCYYGWKIYQHILQLNPVKRYS